MGHLTASVYIPAYNAEKTIEETINSLDILSYPEVNFYILNDGSSDNTLSILKKFETKNLTVIDLKRNNGIDVVYNKIFYLSSTDITFIFHADDVYDSRIISESIQLMEKNPSVGVCFSMSENYFQFAPRQFYKRNNKYIFYNKLELMTDLSKYYNFIMTPSACIRTELVRGGQIQWGNTLLKSKLSQGASGGDLQLWLDIAEVSNVAFINKFLIKWRQHEHQLSKRSKKGLKTFSDFIAVMEFYTARLTDEVKKKEIEYNLISVKFKECVIAKLNCILDKDAKMRAKNNAVLREIFLRFIQNLCLNKFARKKYFKYFILFFIVTLIPFKVFPWLFYSIREKYFLEY